MKETALFALDILSRDCQVGNKGDDQDCKNGADQSIAQAQTTQAVLLPCPVGKRRAQRSGHDIGKPEGNNLVQTKQEEGQGRYSNQHGKQYA